MEKTFFVKLDAPSGILLKIAIITELANDDGQPPCTSLGDISMCV